VRSILFNNSATNNWLGPWHQDATIAVKSRCEVAGFAPWSIKEGEHHCRRSPEILANILVVRIHLDPCGESNGPLRVVPRSHRFGLVEAKQLDSLVETGPHITCTVDEGGLVVMRPHTMHASSRATQPARWRVLHLEFCAKELPSPLRWAEEVHLGVGVTQ